jgi:hypothetical protein
MKPDSAVEWLVAHSASPPLTRGQGEAMVALADNPDFARLVAIKGYQHAVSKWIRQDRRAEVLARLSLWANVLDAMHRATIRQRAFLQPYGWVLGMTLAQQYGFSSELLDFTSDIRIAAFFATHDGPRYQFDGKKLVGPAGAGVGVIFRLPSAEGAVKHKRMDTYNYYTCPPQLHMRDLCLRFEDRSSPEMKEQYVGALTERARAAMANLTIPARVVGGMLTEMEMKGRRLPLLTAVDRYLELYYQEGIRYYRLLDFPRGSFAASRLGRQSAVVIVPDELRVTARPGNQPDYAEFQAVEDLSAREGFERFYFRHSDRPPPLGDIAREHLWPTEHDCFKATVSRVLDPSTPQYAFAGIPIPKRIDMVSTGYAA